MLFRSVLNTNLGRSPLPRDAWNEAAEANCGYSPVEYDLEQGRRGKRGGIVHELAATLTGAEAGLVVNNNAAGVLLALSAIASGREVVVARGEQVQIGGGFRVPDILELAGARFVEVGTTNIVEVADYTKAVGPATACVIIVHTSNFALRGFTSKPSPSQIVAALPKDLPVIVDQGSGCTGDGVPGEASVRTYIDAGCSLVCFSGDKMLGGPQSGIIAGNADLVARLARHPLYRAFRPGKTIFSLLERVLVARLNGQPGLATDAMAIPADEYKKFARKIRSKLPKGVAEVIDTNAAAGGGTGPDEVFPSAGLVIHSPSTPGHLQTALRRAPVPLIALVRDDRVVIDMASLYNEDPVEIAASVEWALERSASLREKARRLAEAGTREAAAAGR